MELTLTPRLQAVADQVPSGCKLADVGTDHAYLPVWLILDGRICHAVAADLREGPLSRAKETAARYEVSEKISFRLCDGLSGIGPDEVDTVVIAGMGGETISAILEAAPWTARETRLLLQPMTSFPDLRVWLQKNGYCIESETIVREGARYYTILSVIGGEMASLSPAEAWAGRQSDDPLRGEYLRFIAGKLNRARMGHLSSRNRDEAAIAKLSEILNGIEEMEKEWFEWRR